MDRSGRPTARISRDLAPTGVSGLGASTGSLWTYIDLSSALNKVANNTDDPLGAYRGVVTSLNQSLSEGIAQGVAKNGLSANVQSIPAPGEVKGKYYLTNVTSAAPESTVRSFVGTVQSKVKSDLPSGDNVSTEGIEYVVDYIKTTEEPPDKSTEVAGDYSEGKAPFWHMREWPLVHWQEVSGNSGGGGGPENGGGGPPPGNNQIISGVPNSALVLGGAGAVTVALVAVAAS